MNPYLKAAIWIVIILAVLAGLGWIFFTSNEVPDHSMAPTLWKGDKVLVLRRGNVHVGDIVACEHPDFPDETIMGRVVGVPGDSVAIKRGQLVRNGSVIHEESVGKFIYMDRESSGEAFEFTLMKKKQIIGSTIAYLLYDQNQLRNDMPKTVVETGYFLMADNRTGGLDSRTFGEVHESLCWGRVSFIWKATKGLGDADETRRFLTFPNMQREKDI